MHMPVTPPAGLQYQTVSGDLMKRARTQQRRMSVGSSTWHTRWFVLRDDMLCYYPSEAQASGTAREQMSLQVSARTAS